MVTDSLYVFWVELICYEKDKTHNKQSHSIIIFYYCYFIFIRISQKYHYREYFSRHNRAVKIWYLIDTAMEIDSVP